MSKKLWEIVKKHAVPTIAFGLSFDSFLNGRRESYRDKYTEEAIKSGSQREQALTEATRQAEIETSHLKVQLCATSERVESSTAEVNYYADKIQQLKAERTNGTITPTHINSNSSNSALDEFYNRMYREALQKQNNYIKELQEISNPNYPDIANSGFDFSELFYDLIDNYKDFMSVLTQEQLAILVNIWGLVIILMILNSITILLLGDQLIKIFKLKTRYPKLADYIKYKQTINQYYLSFYIVFFYFVIIFIVCVNIFMFISEYW